MSEFLSEESRSKGPAVRRFRSSLFSYLRPVVGILLLLILLRMVPLEQVWRQLRGVNPWLLVLLVPLILVAVMLSSLRVAVLLRARSRHVGFAHVLRAHYVGAFFNSLLPTGVGGDVVRIHELCTEDIKARDAFASVVVERAAGLSVVLLLGVAVSLFWGGLFSTLRLEVLRWPLGLGCGAALALMLLAYVVGLSGLMAVLEPRRHRRIWKTAFRLAEGFCVFRRRPGRLSIAFLLSCAFYAVVSVNLVVVCASVGSTLDVAMAVRLIPFMALPEMIPISVGGLGIREGVTTYCLSQVGLTPASAASVALLLRALAWAHSGIGGIVYTLSRRKRPAPGGLGSV